MSVVLQVRHTKRRDGSHIANEKGRVILASKKPRAAGADAGQIGALGLGAKKARRDLKRGERFTFLAFSRPIQHYKGRRS